MLNQPYFHEQEELDSIIEYRISLLLANIKRITAVTLEPEDIDYELLSRCEHLAIKSELLYPEEDLPTKFGVYRGYAGGGMHGSLQKTDISRLSPELQEQASLALEEFALAFRAILRDIDNMSEQASGEKLEAWDGVSI